MLLYPLNKYIGKVVYDRKVDGAKLRKRLKIVSVYNIISDMEKVKSLNIRRSCKMKYILLDKVKIVWQKKDKQYKILD